MFFFFNDTATTEIYTLSLHDALPIWATCEAGATMEWVDGNIGSKVTMKYPAVYLMGEHAKGETLSIAFAGEGQHQDAGDRKSTRLNSSHANISYAVFCLKKIIR